MSTIRKGSRVFGGKKYNFWMFADSHQEAKKRIMDGHRHFSRFNETAFFRITDLVAPGWNKTPSGRRFVIWVRLEVAKK